MRSDAIRPGDVIAGKYRVRAILSRSRGFLVEAFHTEFDQRVVIRVLSPALCDEKEVERFRREARTLAKLESEHVARILDVGTQEDGAFYFVRQYLDGTDLAAHLKKRGSVGLQEATLLVLQAAEALAESHTHNVVLRELQPSHLFLTQRVGGEPLLKIIDFGTAKLMRDAAAPTAGAELTATAMFGLSPYSSPELVRKAKRVDGRADVWSLGAIFYQLLTGKPPFTGEMAALMLQITREDPVPASRVRPGIPVEVDAIIGWAMAKDVDGRFANVHAFAHALTPYAPPEGQVLIQRIAAISTAQKHRQKASAAMRDLDPETIDSDELIDDLEPDKPTRMLSTEYLAPQALPHHQAPAEPESPFENTVFMGADYVPKSPGAALPSAPPSEPGRGSQPVFAGAAADMAAARQSLLGPPLELPGGGGAAPYTRPAFATGPPSAPYRPPSDSNPGVEPPLRPSQPGYAAFVAEGGQGAAPPSTPALARGRGFGPYAEADGVPAGRGMRRVAFAAVASAVLGVTLFAGVFLLKAHPAGGETVAMVVPLDSAAATGAPPAASAGVKSGPSASASAASSVATAAATPSAAASASSAPAASTAPATPDPSASAAASASARAASVAAASTAAATSHASTHTAAVVAPPPPSPPTATAAAAPPSGGNDSGTLVAVAVGGSCAFSVNGAAKGTSSSLKVQLKAGTYAVTCKPESGASKMRSVTIVGGGTAMAMFKLQ